MEAVERCLPVAEVCSIDEMYCRLMGEEQTRDRAVQLARQVKDSIYANAGEALRCSVGLAPNKFLAKVATNLQKPDGLVVIEKKDLPHKLYSLELSDLPGIGRAMEKRLHQRSIRTVEQLCALNEEDLASIWNSVIGRRWFHWLRGDEPYEPPIHRRQVGHQHVLPPQYRTDEGARGVLIRLLCKAAMRLRHIGYWTQRLHVSVRYLDGDAWGADAPLGCCQDTSSLLEAFAEVWLRRPRGTGGIQGGAMKLPFVVGVNLEKLVEKRFAPLPLFPEEQRRLRLSQAMDVVNQRYGRKTLYLGSMHGAIDTAPLRIAFTCIPDLDLQA
ncbi:MAG: DNA polymerase [Planctomycetota bacterium]|nr:DNA polymerase [Planctomycetota bacterium]